jgi:hypothetical protein
MRRRGNPVAAAVKDDHMDRDSERGAIGGSSRLGTENAKMHYNTSAVQIGNAVRDGDDFVLLTRSKQGEGFQVWSSTDKTATEPLLKQAIREFDLVPTT